MSKKSVIESTEIALDAKLVKASEKTAQAITSLTDTTKAKVDTLKVALIVTTGERMRDGVTQVVAVASLKANESIIGFTASKATFCPTALDLMEKEPDREWSADELLSVAERVYRTAGEQAKGIKGAPKGKDGAKVIIDGADTVDALIQALPAVKARAKAEKHAMTIEKALDSLIESVQALEVMTVKADILPKIVKALELLAHVQRESMRQVA